ncbi:MAG: hypothetical protein L6R41_003285 [Letrouitia leprolyta]|nr:MAG: hypothetical protein L6R41_003285 [Letrouitia leprolyta]
MAEIEKKVDIELDALMQAAIEENSSVTTSPPGQSEGVTNAEVMHQSNALIWLSNSLNFLLGQDLGLNLSDNMSKYMMPIMDLMIQPIIFPTGMTESQAAGSQNVFDEPKAFA